MAYQHSSMDTKNNHDADPRLDRLYATQLEPKDYIEQKDGGKFIDYEDYLANPERYQSNFHHKVSVAIKWHVSIKLTLCRLLLIQTVWSPVLTGIRTIPD